MDRAVEFREPTVGDAAEIARVCLHMDPGDYVPAAWKAWTSDPQDVNLVAECDGRIVGCVHAGRVSPTEVFFQGLRVLPEFRREGLATRMMRRLSERLREVGVSVMRCTTAATNDAAQSLFRKSGIREVGAVARRWPALRTLRREHRGGVSLVTDFDGARWPGLLASQPGAAHFKRIYASPTESFWVEVTRRGRLVGMDDRAFALLDAPANREDNWVTALTGPIDSIRRLIVELVGSGGRWTVDAPPDPAMQTMLDELGFSPAGPDDRYVILEGRSG